ncbi:hypothetical protein AAHA92_17334 [Salvia divinorum]|uniref:Uncharacterized protein n=1 Tax=Salvia divinorum TaxID=28513 RepID=A0ABD1GYL0_SALDI
MLWVGLHGLANTFLMTKNPPTSRVSVAMIAIDKPTKPWKQCFEAANARGGVNFPVESSEAKGKSIATTTIGRVQKNGAVARGHLDGRDYWTWH